MGDVKRSSLPKRAERDKREKEQAEEKKEERMRGVGGIVNEAKQLGRRRHEQHMYLCRLSSQALFLMAPNVDLETTYPARIFSTPSSQISNYAKVSSEVGWPLGGQSDHALKDITGHLQHAFWQS